MSPVPAGRTARELVPIAAAALAAATGVALVAGVGTSSLHGTETASVPTLRQATQEPDDANPPTVVVSPRRASSPGTSSGASPAGGGVSSASPSGAAPSIRRAPRPAAPAGRPAESRTGGTVLPADRAGTTLGAAAEGTATVAAQLVAVTDAVTTVAASGVAPLSGTSTDPGARAPAAAGRAAVFARSPLTSLLTLGMPVLAPEVIVALVADDGPRRPLVPPGRAAQALDRLIALLRSTGHGAPGPSPAPPGWVAYLSHPAPSAPSQAPDSGEAIDSHGGDRPAGGGGGDGVAAVAPPDGSGGRSMGPGHAGAGASAPGRHGSSSDRGAPDRTGAASPPASSSGRRPVPAHGDGGPAGEGHGRGRGHGRDGRGSR